jgi:hypothetical protein
VAISNHRLVALEDDQVTFAWKDYADGHRRKEMRLTAEEFLRRFLLPGLPPRFVRIRHYGLMAGRNVDTRLARCRELLPGPATAAGKISAPRRPWYERVQEWTGQDPRVCPYCQGPLLRRPLERTSGGQPGTASPREPAGEGANTS